MKTIILNLLATMLLFTISLQTDAQGMIYDQQSATGGVSLYADNVDGLNIQEDSPLVQSFIPTLSEIGFVQFEFWDIPDNGNNGATVYVKLWTGWPDVNSPLATLLGSTIPVYMPDGFQNPGLGGGGITNFYFSTPIALTASQTYFLQPVVSGDDPWDIITIGDTYPNGQVFERGAGFNTDMWFREGIVPEPSALALIGLSGLLAFAFNLSPCWQK
ncbi:MAG: PEP-CTERM sorting domain-containing protein [Limisphaerales bacterium]